MRISRPEKISSDEHESITKERRLLGHLFGHLVPPKHRDPRTVDRSVDAERGGTSVSASTTQSPHERSLTKPGPNRTHGKTIADRFRHVGKEQPHVPNANLWRAL